MDVNIIDMLTAKTLDFSVFALIVTLIVIFVTLITPKFRIIAIPFIFVGAYIFLAVYTFFLKKNQQKKETYNEGTCSVCSTNTYEGSKLLPIMEPAFNLREVAKNLLLLEDHLFHNGKRCPDCCIKHSLLIDGLLDESKTLDKKGQYTEIIEDVSLRCKESLKNLENLIKREGLSNSNACIEIAQQLRESRKIITSAMITNII